MDTNLLRYIWKHTRSQQTWVLFIVLLSLPTYFLSLDLPKQIINGPIQGDGFDTAVATQPFFRIAFSMFSTEEWVLFEGFDLARLNMLWALSLTFLALVIVNGLFKFYINTYKGRLGERMLRRLRYTLLDRLLRFPQAHFKRVKSAEVASMVKDEVEPLGSFIGDSFVLPVFVGGQALTAMIFILVQSWALGLMAFVIIGIQFIIIPRLRRRLIELNRQRQIAARKLSGRVSEIVEGIGAVHVNDTSNYERADISNRLGKIFFIRYELYQRKFFVKFLNNFLAQVTPFLFYAFGGYFALTGRLDIGQLVAVIAAYKDLPSPIKDLIDWDQQRIDVQVKYSQVMEQFTVDNISPPELQKVESNEVNAISEKVSASNVAVIDDTGAKLIERASLTISSNEQIAFVGSANSGAQVMSEALARLQIPTSGTIKIGDNPIDEIPESITGHRTGYSAGESFLPQGTVRDNLLYVLKHAPLNGAVMNGEETRKFAQEQYEAGISGNTQMDVRADWIDYKSIGCSGPEDLLKEIKRVLELTDLDSDLFDLGLRGVIDPDENRELADKILSARAALRERLKSPELSGLVEVFDPASYSQNGTIAQNLMFGTPVGDEFADTKLAGNAYLRSILKDLNLEESLYSMGIEIAKTALELFQDLPPDHPFFEQLSFMTPEQIPDYQVVLQRVQNVEFSKASDSDRSMIMGLPFAYIEPRHRFGLLDENLMALLVKARVAFRDNLPEQYSDRIEFFDPESYNRLSSIQDNLLLGRVTHGVAGGPERVLGVIRDLIEQNELSDEVLNVGLDFNVGSGGKRLTLVQRQKLGLARVLIKRPDYAFLNKPLAALDQRQQETIVDRVIADSRNNDRSYGLVWVVGNAGLALKFGRVVVFDQGKLVEDGSPEKLKKKNGVFTSLLG